jgi:hypothetical protein
MLEAILVTALNLVWLSAAASHPCVKRLLLPVLNVPKLVLSVWLVMPLRSLLASAVKPKWLLFAPLRLQSLAAASKLEKQVKHPKPTP